MNTKKAKVHYRENSNDIYSCPLHRKSFKRSRSSGRIPGKNSSRPIQKPDRSRFSPGTSRRHNFLRLVAFIKGKGKSLSPGFSRKSLHKCQSKLCHLLRFVASSPHPILLGAYAPKTPRQYVIPKWSRELM